MKFFECLGCAVLTAVVVGGTIIGIKYLTSKDSELDIDTLG